MAELFLRKADNEPIEANLVTSEHADAIALWCGGVAVIEHDAFQHEKTYAGINVPTARGMQRASEDSWIIRTTTGNFEVVNPNLFPILFEPVKDIPKTSIDD